MADETFPQIAAVTRRQFVKTTVAVLGTGTLAQAQTPLTVQAFADRLKARVGVPWIDKTVDGLKAGNPADPVSGIAVAVSATMPVLQRAASAGLNLVVVDEPTFYGVNDEPGNRATDPVYLAKKAFLEQHRLAVWRFSDHWNARRPAEGPRALAETLWPGAKPVDRADDVFSIPETTLGALVAHVRAKLGVSGGVRTIGPSTLRVRTVLVSPGSTDLPSTAARLSRADVVLAGEPREWEVVPYVLDARTPGQAKGLLAVGRLVSRGPGSRACAEWIRSITPETRVEVQPVADPYWSPLS